MEKWRVDLHCHTANYSACAVSPAEEVIEVASKRLDTLFITDHHHVFPRQEIAYLTAKYEGLFGKLTVLSGQEVTVFEGGDVLIYGIEESIPARIPLRTLREIVKSYRYDGVDVVAIWAHPYRFGAPLVDYKEWMDFVDAIEGFNGNCTHEENIMAVELAREMAKPFVAGSDAHRACDVARFYNYSEFPIKSVQDLKRAILKGAIKPACLEKVLKEV